MNSKIFIPSFEHERKTQAFNKIIYVFVFLISMFTIFLLVIAPHVMLVSILKIISTFIKDHMLLVIFIPVTLFIISSYQLLKFFTMLMTSYKFENNRIIKGRIMTNNMANKTTYINDGDIEKLSKHLSDSTDILLDSTKDNLNNIFNLISANIKRDFVERYFDTDIYKKIIYDNPILVKETKYNLIYKCNNKKLVIPKIYEGIGNIGNKESSFASRIFIRCFIIFILFFLISITDLIIGFNKNNELLNNINNSFKIIESNLTYFDYEVYKVNETCYEFNKELNDDYTSKIKYYFDKNGNIDDIEFDLYFNKNYKPLEVSFILENLNDEFSDSEINTFIEQINSCINNECGYDKLVSKNNTIRISTSGGFIHVHK